MFGNKLRETRELRQMTQQELADRVGISGRQIWRYENEGAMPAADILSRIARELEVSMDYLAGLVNDPQGHLSEEDLSPDERKLVAAYRRGDWPALMRVIANGGKEPEEQPGIASEQPATNRKAL